VPIKPAPELLGDVLLALNRPSEAVPFFEQALARNRNRSRSVLGLARAAAGTGDAAAVRKHYTALLDNLRDADADLPLVREARAALESSTNVSTPAPAVRDGRIIAGVVTAFIVAAGVLFVRRRKQTAAAPKPARQANRKRRR